MYIYSATFYKNSQKCIRGERKYKESNCIRGSKGCMSDIRDMPDIWGGQVEYHILSN